MPNAPDNHEAHDYAERIRERLPRRHQELREAIGLSMYALWLKCGVSRDTVSRIEGCETIRRMGIANKIGMAERGANVSWYRRHENAFALRPPLVTQPDRRHLCDDADDDFRCIGGNVAH